MSSKIKNIFHYRSIIQYIDKDTGVWVIVFILSWLTPIIFILIKLESPGTLYFKQKRHGLKRKAFWCYKFRSMTTTSDADVKMAKKNDARLTRIGKILRKTILKDLKQRAVFLYLKNLPNYTKTNKRSI